MIMYFGVVFSGRQRQRRQQWRITVACLPYARDSLPMPLTRNLIKTAARIQKRTRDSSSRTHTHAIHLYIYIYTYYICTHVYKYTDTRVHTYPLKQKPRLPAKVSPSIYLHYYGALNIHRMHI